MIRRTEITQALIWAILGAQLLLPAGISVKFPMIPVLDKGLSIPSITAILLGCALTGRARIWHFQKIGLVEILLILFAFQPLITALLNGDLIVLSKWRRAVGRAV